MNSKKTNSPIREREKDLKDVTKEDRGIANKQFKRCVPPLTIRKMEIKATMRYKYIVKNELKNIDNTVSQ